MTAPNQRTALASLDAARPVLARLDPARNAEENAADLIEVWTGMETALRSLLGGSMLAGQALVRDLRQHEMISLDQGHALLESLAVHDRVQSTNYQPTATDISEMRDGFQALDQSVRTPMPAPDAPAAWPASPASPASGVSGPAPADPLPPTPFAPARSAMPSTLIVIGGLIILLLAAGFYYFARRSGVPGEIQSAEAEYAAGRRDQARADFEQAAKDYPALATPHIYLARIARDQGDLAVAGAQIATAVKLEPQNAIANRELGAFFLARGTQFSTQGRPDLATPDYEGARRAYVRALQLDPTDLSSQGYLGCVLARLGRAPEGSSFLARAGQGPWSSCAAPAAPAERPGASAAGVPAPSK